MRKILKWMWFLGSSYSGFSNNSFDVCCGKKGIFLIITWSIWYFCQKRSCASSIKKFPIYFALRGTTENYLICLNHTSLRKIFLFFSENQFDIFPVSRLSHASWNYSQSRWPSAGQTIYSISNFRHTIIAGQQLKQKTYIWIPNRNDQVKWLLALQSAERGIKLFKLRSELKSTISLQLKPQKNVEWKITANTKCFIPYPAHYTYYAFILIITGVRR